MVKQSWRLVLAAFLAVALAACSSSLPPQPEPPTLSELAGDTAALSSFVALVEELGIDLDAVSSDGTFTVFAPSNTLLDDYAVQFGYADAAAMITALETAPATLRTAVIRFVASHVVDYQPGVLTEAFITDDITETDEWYLYYCYLGDCNGYFNLYWDSGNDTPANAYYQFYFYGGANDISDDAEVFVTFDEPVFVAADVPFDNGIVHVMDATVDGGSLDYFVLLGLAD